MGVIGAAVLTVWALCLAAPAAAQLGQRAGVAGAVRGKVTLAAYNSPQSAIGRAIASGEPIRLGDRIKTGPNSGLQIMLLDQTTFTIGPDAEMVVDKFVYDPARKTGSMSARILKGTFRFVSGAIARSNPEAVEIKTPAATIGIRGTAMVGRTNGSNLLVILAGPGRRNNVGRPASRIIVRAGGRTIVIFRTGFGVFVRDVGAGPSAPQRYSLSQIRSLLNSLTSSTTNQDADNADPGNSNNTTNLGNQAGDVSGQSTQQGSETAGQQNQAVEFVIDLLDTSTRPPDLDNPPDNVTVVRRRRRIAGFGRFKRVTFGEGEVSRLLIFLRLRGRGFGRFRHGEAEGHHRRRSRKLVLVVKRVLRRDEGGRPRVLLVSVRSRGRHLSHRRRLAVVTLRRLQNRPGALLTLRRLRMRGGEGEETRRRLGRPRRFIVRRGGRRRPGGEAE